MLGENNRSISGTRLLTFRRFGLRSTYWLEALEHHEPKGAPKLAAPHPISDSSPMGTGKRTAFQQLASGFLSLNNVSDPATRKQLSSGLLI